LLRKVEEKENLRVYLCNYNATVLYIEKSSLLIKQGHITPLSGSNTTIIPSENILLNNPLEYGKIQGKIYLKIIFIIHKIMAWKESFDYVYRMLN
jgi:hypothetical protein